MLDRLKYLADLPRQLRYSVNFHKENVSIDRVKPAFLESEIENREVIPTTNSSEQFIKIDSANDNNTSFSPNSVICAKSHGYPPWPAIVIDITGTPLENRRAPTGSIPVKFFGTNRFAFVPINTTSDFKSSYNTKHRSLKRAYTLAENFLKQQVTNSVFALETLTNSLKKVRKNVCFRTEPVFICFKNSILEPPFLTKGEM